MLIIFVELINESSYGNEAIDRGKAKETIKLLFVDMESKIVVQAVVSKYYVRLHS